MGCGASGADTAPDNVRQNNMSSIPLKAPKQFELNPQVTHEELKDKRQAFWDTRVDNNLEIWRNLHMAADALVEGDLANATAIISVNGIKTPQGSLARCYDERGAEYRVPNYCYTTPLNLLVGTTRKQQDTSSLSDAKWTLRIRVAPWDSDYSVAASPKTSVSELKETICKALSDNPPAGIQNGSRVIPRRLRVVFWGKELTDLELLGHTRVKDEALVQVFMRPEKLGS